MSLIYIEYFSRRPGVDLDAFRAGVAEGQQGWDSGYDARPPRAQRRAHLAARARARVLRRLALPALRLRPPRRLATAIFRGGEADHLEGAFFRVARIDVAGCYSPLIEPVHTRYGTYYVEFFRPRAAAEAISAFYEERTRRHPRLRLEPASAAHRASSPPSAGGIAGVGAAGVRRPGGDRRGAGRRR